MFSQLFNIVSFITYLYLTVSTIYFLIFSLAGKFKKRTRFGSNPCKNNIAVLIPAYREDDIILDSVQKICAHNYPRSSFQVIVIADSLKMSTLDKLRLMPVQVLEVKFEISLKAKSINAALEFLPPTQFDIGVILDADNVMADNCLEKVNDAFCKGFKAIQCHRIAKNQDTPIAILGAVSEEININLFRRGQAALGFSVAPLGSGMAIEFNLLKEIFSGKEILESAGEDREIDIQLLKRKVFMGFIDDAYVYDEKVSSARVFEKQRIRWFEAQWNNARRFFKPDMRRESKTLVYFNKLFQTLVLPRLLYFTIYGAVLLAFLFLWLLKLDLVAPSLNWWLACLAVYIFVLIVSIPGKLYTIKLLKAITYIPLLMVAMLRAVVKMKRHRKDFLHTSKSFVEK